MRSSSTSDLTDSTAAVFGPLSVAFLWGLSVVGLSLWPGLILGVLVTNDPKSVWNFCFMSFWFSFSQASKCSKNKNVYNCNYYILRL